MVKFFKTIGKAILYIIGFPFLIAALSIACIASIFIFLFQLGKLIYLFFTGRNLFSDLEEDVKAKAIIERNSIINDKKEDTLSDSGMDLYPSTSPVYGSDYSSPVENSDQFSSQEQQNNDEINSQENEQVKEDESND